MIFRVYKASDCLHEHKEEKEINTIEDLARLDEETGGYGLILAFNDPPNDQTITIYDDYVE